MQREGSPPKGLTPTPAAASDRLYPSLTIGRKPILSSPPDLVILLTGLCMTLPAFAMPGLRIAVSDSDGPPIAVITRNQLTSGLSYDLGQALAAGLQAKPQFIIVSRKRIEWSLEHGRVDLVCNANPKWYSDAAELKWSLEIFPQVERIATLRMPLDIQQTRDLEGKRIVTIHGYNYPTLEPLWVDGRTSQQTETRLDLMMKALSTKLADAAVVSELEFVYWTRRYPANAAQIKLHPLVVSSVPTMCALSPKSAWSIDQLNHAIERMRKTGLLKTMLLRYQWQAM